MRTPISPPQQKDFDSVSAEGIKWLELLRSKSVDLRQIFAIYNPASVAANTTVEQTTTVDGLKSDDIVLRVIKPSHTAGISVNDGRVTADNTLGITFTNASGSPIDPGEEIYTVIYIKNSRL